MKSLFIIAVVIALGGAGVLFLNNPQESTIPPPPVNDFVTQTLTDNRDALEFAGTDFEEEQNTVYADTKEKKGIVTRKESVCKGDKSTDWYCYEEYYNKLVQEESIEAAFAAIRAEYPKNAYVKSQCHPLMHVIGRAAEANFDSVSDAFADGDGFCWSGYYHGVMEAVIGKIGRKNLPEQIDTICKKVGEERKYSFDHYNCVHGLGHGVMAVTNTELFDSLRVCDNIEDAWERSSCWSGAFMENVIVDGLNHFTKYLRPEEPMYPCTAVEDKYKQTCYLMQTSYALKVTRGDFRRVFDLCADSDEKYVATCYQSLGRDASGRSVSNVAVTKATCDLGSDYNQKSNCVIGAVKDFVSYYDGDTEAKEFCGALDAELQDICFTTAINYAKVL